MSPFRLTLKKYHTLGSLNNGNLFLMGVQGWKPAWLHSDEDSLPSFLLGYLLPRSLRDRER